MKPSSGLHPLLRELLALGLPRSHHALFGSGPLLARGWIDDVGDLDVLVRGPAWERALQLGERQWLDTYAVEVVRIGSGITAGTRWAIGDLDTDDLIDGAEIIANIPCVRLHHVIAYKRLAGRSKDLRHLAIIAARLGTSRGPA